MSLVGSNVGVNVDKVSNLFSQIPHIFMILFHQSLLVENDRSVSLT